MTEVPKFNKTQGAYKFPRYKCFFLDGGVPAQRAYRALSSVRRLEKKQGITHFSFILLS